MALRLPMAGDIILIEGLSTVSGLNKVVQRLLRPSLSSSTFVPSHAALAVNASGTFVHATKNKKVDFVSISHLIDEREYRRYKVYRNKKLEESLASNPEENKMVSVQAVKYWGEKYRITPLISENAAGVFCLMLVSQIYDAMDRRLSIRKSRHVLPSDIENELSAEKADWKDVTHIYHGIFDINSSRWSKEVITGFRNDADDLARERSYVQGWKRITEALRA